MDEVVLRERATNRDTFDALAARTGDEKAFARLVRRNNQLLNRHLHRFTNNETVLQDLRQETYVEAYRSLATFRNEGAFSSWIMKIASRVGYRYWAKQIRDTKARTAFVELLRHHTAGPSKLMSQDDMEYLMGLLANLSGYDRLLLEMKYVQGLKSVEIAHSMGWSPTRVRVRLHRTLKKLNNIHTNNHE